MTVVKSEQYDGSNTGHVENTNVFDNIRVLPDRTRQTPPPQYPLNLELHPITKANSLLISVNPPRQPEEDVNHVPCDIVLVIDVSGSMDDPAPLPDTQDPAAEPSGLSILDLTKHAARTVLENMNEHDRLAVVTFSHEAKVIQPLTYVTKNNKRDIEIEIEVLEVEGATNLWAGLKTGLKVFEDAEFNGNVQGLYVLTDGMPNYMCPKQGYVTKLRPILEEMTRTRPCIPTIHTFGFGYSILSNLLQSIAEVGHGSYAFIPDAGMIGTVFVHAVANLFSTYATSATLKLVTPADCGLICTSGHDMQHTSSTTTVVALGNVQYGQSRVIVLTTEVGDIQSTVRATLEYRLPSGKVQTTETTVPLLENTKLPQSVVQYHLYRNAMCTLLSSLFPIGDNGEHIRQDSTDSKILQAKLADTLASMDSRTVDPADADIVSLFSDLRPSSDISSDGQVTHALTQTTEKPYWRKWGRHYLPSLLHAHLAQQCNSFKDPGPLRYGINSPLFVKCRDELDAAFDNLRPPKPSLFRYQSSTAGRAPVRMSRFNSSSNPCFLGTCTVPLADGQTVRVEQLRPGMSISNKMTGKEREIVAVVKTSTRNPSPTTKPYEREDSQTKQQICRVGLDGPWITPYHPILHAAPSSIWKWVFPIDIATQTRDLDDNEAVYSILLNPSTNPDDHVINIDGVNCVTLGHGLTSSSNNDSNNNSTVRTETGNDSDNDSDSDSNNDIRHHSFLGDYSAVMQNLALLPRDTEGRYLSAGVEKDSLTGLAARFLPLTPCVTAPEAVVVDYEGDKGTSWWKALSARPSEIRV